MGERGVVGDEGAVDSLGVSSDATDSGGGDGLVCRNCLRASFGISSSASRSSTLVVGNLRGKHGEDLTRLRVMGRRVGVPLGCSPSVSRTKALLNMHGMDAQFEVTFT